ncbi:acyloxyacyl hydrolase [Schlegelella sp. S2-27]|uniref:Lipid A deacylase n=1 Tax=Caldimonas mangrovi TaxID=2944811 RepID=A0ABT0YMW7_9BURK|nr:acyloxyacyl hydrolase [Caldimonas mangrovi]
MLFFSFYRWFMRASVGKRFCVALLCGASLLAAKPSRAADASSFPAWMPEVGFVQIGRAQETRATVFGLIWPWEKAWRMGGGQWSGYWELALGRWSTPGVDGRDRAWVTQFGVTPVFRFRPSEGRSRWFLEAGIGLTVMSPIYRSPSKRFSTAFNFGDHLAVGRNFGENAQHELSLRYQHFSNGGVDHPNPGEDFIQLRYATSFR